MTEIPQLNYDELEVSKQNSNSDNYVEDIYVMNIKMNLMVLMLLRDKKQLIPLEDKDKNDIHMIHLIIIHIQMIYYNYFILQINKTILYTKQKKNNIITHFIFIIIFLFF